MSGLYVDTNFLFVHMRRGMDDAPPNMTTWRQRVFDRIAASRGVVSGLTLDELAYRLVVTWLRDDGVKDPSTKFRAENHKVMRSMRRRLASTWVTIDDLGLELQPTDASVVDRALQYMARPALAPRDAFHAAHAVEARCNAIVSGDSDFDRISVLERLGP